MTRKDFNLIADILIDFKPGLDTPITNFGKREAAFKKYHSQMVACFANSLASTNPRFDLDRFLHACGYETEVT